MLVFLVSIWYLCHLLPAHLLPQLSIKIHVWPAHPLVLDNLAWVCFSQYMPIARRSMSRLSFYIPSCLHIHVRCAMACPLALDRDCQIRNIPNQQSYTATIKMVKTKARSTSSMSIIVCPRVHGWPAVYKKNCPLSGTLPIINMLVCWYFFVYGHPRTLKHSRERKKSRGAQEWTRTAVPLRSGHNFSLRCATNILLFFLTV